MTAAAVTADMGFEENAIFMMLLLFARCVSVAVQIVW